MKLLIIIILIALGLAILARLKGAKPVGELPYVRKQPFFSKAERSFYGVLKQAFGQQYEIFSHVRVADLLNVKKGIGKSEWQKAFNKIQSKHIDFVLCKPDDLSVVACIELDDGSHNAAKRIERDDFLNSAFQITGIPLLRIKAQASYTASGITQQLKHALGVPLEEQAPLSIQPAIEPPKKVPVTAQTDDPAPTLCPKCSSAMVKKQATKGKHAGSYFLACTAYPACKTILPIDVAQQGESGI